jgi:acetyl esterase/lipase
MLRSIGAPLALLLGFCVTTAWSAERYEIDFRPGVEYGKGGDESLQLDLALPKGASKPTAGIVFIHGGGWARGNRAAHVGQVKEVAAQGYLAATVSYRFAPKHPFPAQVEDCKCAVRYLRAHASELNLDPKRIGAIGFSAGAHLSMMLGTLDTQDGLEGNGGWQDQPSKVQAVVAYFGPTDLTVEYPPASREIVAGLIGGTLADKSQDYRRASPIAYVDKSDAPMLLFQGTTDVLVPYQQGIAMAEALVKAGVPGRVELMLGHGHGWGGKELTRTAFASMQFFQEWLVEKPLAAGTAAGK